MIHNFEDVDEDDGNFPPIPVGNYLCEVTNSQYRLSAAGNPCWSLELTILVGTHVGRKIFDNVTFTPAAYKRTKLVLKRLGLDVSRTIDDEKPELAIGKQAHVNVIIVDEVYNGQSVKRNRVPFDGYTAIKVEENQPAAQPRPQSQPQAVAADADDNVPF